jgi:hypothetical protein
MNDHDLDQSYTRLCETMARVGEEKTPLLLATLCLSLISRQSDVDEVQRLMAQAEAACAG